ncbi:cysteine synthase [Desulfoplanes formicivorans]|uniref:cysteine synthase n=1 Tax=Desulfoplanes formicivorans TaxID=1592317 RepID=A0A194AFU0_9BACT|nr:cysteine synthase [Desulfoplanes formicivorans]GAU08198.1 cysteine synthase [Desulfoplanes formicivorans]
MIHHNVLQTLGRTPLVRINRLNPNPGVIIAGKMEVANPGGSIKDRVALAMIEAAEKQGILTRDKIIIEPTSGNTGIGLAMVCAVKGYRLMLLMPESASEERKKILRAYGADIRLTPGHLATDGAIEEAYRLAREEPDTYVLMDQYNNAACIEAHYRGTGQEIWDQTDGQVTHVIACLGTSGTAMGICKRLKELNSTIEVIAVEPYAGHRIQGLKNMQESYPPGIYDKHALDRIIHVDDEDAFAMCRDLARKEGLFVGMSSGAAMAGAVQVARDLTSGLMVCILPDGGDRYLSTPLFTPPAKTGMGLLDTRTQSLVYPAASSRALGLFTFGPSLERVTELEPWRRVVLLDVIRRYTEFKGGQARAVVGIADYDDRTILGARESKVSREAFTRMRMQSVAATARMLGVGEEAVFEPASNHVQTMLGLCEKLLEKGLAYEKLRSVYFDIMRDKEYGDLSCIDLNKLSLGKTVDLTDYVKENPRDFTLFKRATLQDLKEGTCLKTKWGNVRPSWYLQMAGIGVDLLDDIGVCLAGTNQVFPHLENLRSIWAVEHKAGVKAWMVSHGVDRKSDEFSLCDMEECLALGIEPRAIRMWLLASSYHKPLTASRDNLVMWQRNWRHVQDLVVTLWADSFGDHGGVSQEVRQALFDLKQGFGDAFDTDLGLHHFWPELFKFCKMVKQLHAAGGLNRAGALACRDQLESMDKVLGIVDYSGIPLGESAYSEAIRELINKRALARRQKDFKAADALRDEIAAAGFRIVDTRDGVRVYRQDAG